MPRENEPIDAEVIEPAPRRRAAAAEPAPKPRAPFHFELFAWPEQLRGQAVLTKDGRRREFSIDGSLLIFLLQYLNNVR